jgi:ATP-dependent DNA helicase RecG
MAITSKPISATDSALLATRTEDHFFDKKAAEISGAKLQKVAVAFANADGGEIYIGIRDDKDEPDPAKRWAGAASIESFNQHIQALNDVQPPLPVEYCFLRQIGSSTYVLQVQVEKSQSVHKTTEGKVYERKGAQSLPVTDPSRITDYLLQKERHLTKTTL